MGKKVQEKSTAKLSVTKSTVERLMKRAHYGQTQNGVLMDLLDLVDKMEHNKDNDKPQILPKEN